MAQPIRKRLEINRRDAVTSNGGTIEFCNECPFLGYDFETLEYMCNPNDWKFGRAKGNIPVPK